jgi:hypothetical protein
MARETLIRYRVLNNDKLIMVQRERHTWYSWPFFLFTNGVWCDWFLLNELEYQLHDELNAMAAQFKAVLAELDGYEKTLKASLGEVKAAGLATRGYGEPFRMNVELVVDKVIRDAPKQDWRTVFTGDPKKHPNAYEKIYGPNAKRPGDKQGNAHKTLVTTSDLKPYAKVYSEFQEDMGADEVQFWDNDKGQNKGNNAPGSKNWRKRRQDESESDHRFRLETYKNGEWTRD